MSASFNDGTVQYGSRVWVIKKNDGTTARDTFVADNITVNRPTKLIKRTDQLGEPSGSVGVPDFVEGSATLQIASSSTLLTQAGDQIICDGTVNAKLDASTGGAGSETFFVHSVGEPFTKDGETKLNISFIKKYN